MKNSKIYIAVIAFTACAATITGCQKGATVAPKSAQSATSNLKARPMALADSSGGDPGNPVPPGRP